MVKARMGPMPGICFKRRKSSLSPRDPLSSLFQLLPKLAKPTHLVEQNPEHGHCFRIFSDRQSNGTLGAMVNVFEKPALGDLAADDRPSLGNKLLSIALSREVIVAGVGNASRKSNSH